MNVFTLEEKNGVWFRGTRTLPETSGERLSAMKSIIGFGCRAVDCRKFSYKDQEFDVWFDDEFLYQEKPTATLFLGEVKPDRFTVLCGNLIFARSDEEGMTYGLTEKDVSLLWEFTDISSIRLSLAFSKGLIG